ncbi:hypothetical protein [Enterococcus olivae]
MYINFDEHEAIRHAELDAAFEQGFQRGFKQGFELELEQIARNLLEMDCLPLAQISEATGLTQEKILKIQKESKAKYV